MFNSVKLVVFCAFFGWQLLRQRSDHHSDWGPRQLTSDNADWLKRAILNLFLLSPEPSCPNPHFVTKSLRRNHCNEIVASRSVCSRSVCRGQLTCLAATVAMPFFYMSATYQIQSGEKQLKMVLVKFVVWCLPFTAYWRRCLLY